MSLRALLASCVLVALVGGCATPSKLQAPIEGDHLSGRLALKVEGDSARSFSAAFELDGGPALGQLSLTSPLGTRVAEARWAPGSAVLANSDGKRVYADLQDLSRDALGESVPLVALFDWLQGRPWSGAPAEAREGGFEQLGWRIDLQRQAEGLIVVTRSVPTLVSLRVKLDSK
ncbi:MAG TPA: outer membrane lipoprotein LolB [Methylibium sp.]